MESFFRKKWVIIKKFNFKANVKNALEKKVNKIKEILEVFKKKNNWQCLWKPVSCYKKFNFNVNMIKCKLKDWWD